MTTATEEPAARLDAVTLTAAAPEELAEFYRQALGLAGPSHCEGRHIGFTLANTYLGIEAPDGPLAGPPPAVTLWFHVADAEATCRRMQSLGALVLTEPTGDESPGEILAVVADPEGNRVGLIQKAAQG